MILVINKPIYIEYSPNVCYPFNRLFRLLQIPYLHSRWLMIKGNCYLGWRVLIPNKRNISLIFSLFVIRKAENSLFYLQINDVNLAIVLSTCKDVLDCFTLVPWNWLNNRAALLGRKKTECFWLLERVFKVYNIELVATSR